MGATSAIINEVATALTACGIETFWNSFYGFVFKLQQRLPLAVLKPSKVNLKTNILPQVATALTACGIETRFRDVLNSLLLKVATVLTAYGIETYFLLMTCYSQ